MSENVVEITIANMSGIKRADNGLPMCTQAELETYMCKTAKNRFWFSANVNGKVEFFLSRQPVQKGTLVRISGQKKTMAVNTYRMKYFFLEDA
ncbi:MAG: hypothetical protein ACOZAO_04675 [Patescibacteria group bacterium]